jgi:predicted DNA-binding protein
VRFSETEYKELQELAKRADRKVSEYIRRATIKYIDIKKDYEEI